jgi:hypothetical protein
MTYSASYAVPNQRLSASSSVSSRGDLRATTMQRAR